jgi:lysophospholipase L1-like esterase
VEILLLGDSDTAGIRIAGPSWPELLKADLDSDGGGAVTIHTVMFTPVPASAAAYAERRAREQNADVIILPVSAWGFTLKFVEYRVQRLLGKRVAQWYKRGERRFDRATSSRGRPLGRVNRAGRKLARTVLGAQAQISRRQLAEHYREIFNALARIEDTQVVAMMYPALGARALSPKTKAHRAAFQEEMREAALARHFVWLDSQGIFLAGRDIDEFALDELHFTDEGHRLIAEAMLQAIKPLAGAPLRAEAPGP